MQAKKTIQTMSQSTPFLDGAVAVGEQLISLAVRSGRHIAWKRIDKLTKTESFDSNNLYAGASGIGLFFLELYKHTGKEKYLRIARKAIQTASSREKNKSVNPAFITGRLGVSYALLKLYEATEDRKYLEQALALAKTCRGIFSGAHEYINGNAGSVVCLLHLHAASHEPWLLELVNDYMERIVQGTQQASTGVYWDRHAYQIRPLCGFSHGTSGIGFMFLELGRYLKNAAYYGVADQAFAYENAYFDTASGNWPDFRLNMWKPEQIAAMESAYARQDLAVFIRAGDMVAWCHGAPGIGLSRILAYRLTRKHMYLEDLNHAVTATKRTHVHNLSLCHGQAGNLDMFIESYVVLGRKRDWQYAAKAGKKLLQEWKQLYTRARADKAFAERQDFDLFTGIAGVGYTLLRLHDPQLTPSILTPRLPATASAKPQKELQFLRLTHDDVQGVLAADSEENAAIRQVRHEMEVDYPSSGLLFIKLRVQGKLNHKLLQLSDDELLKRSLQLDKDCRLRMTSSTEGVLLRYAPTSIEQKSITPFCYIILTAFTQPQKVQMTIARLAETYGYTAPDQRKLLQSKVLEQVRQALSAIILIPPQA